VNVTTVRPLGSAGSLEAELDRLLDLDPSFGRSTSPTPVAASPLCLCWPDEDER
jgi:hypothetical protein